METEKGNNMTDPMIVAVSEGKRHRVRLRVDKDAASPRELTDNVIVHAVTVPNSRYADVAGAGPLSEAWERVKDRHDAVKVFERYAVAVHSAATLHDAPHDGSEVVWYMLPDGMVGVPNPVACMEGERDIYRAWASGEVFGYVIEEAVDWVRGDGQNGGKSTWEPVDDNEGEDWGLIGCEFAEAEAKRKFSTFLLRNA